MSENVGDGNVLGDTHACRDLHRTRNQRLLARRVLISTQLYIEIQSPSALSRRAPNLNDAVVGATRSSPGS